MEDIGAEIARFASEELQESVSNDVFVPYQHVNFISGALPHGGDIVEAASLAAVSLPEVTYPLADAIPRRVIDSGQLSSLQLEGIAFACQRHQTILSNGIRAGFFIGDAAGVGKGRQISGVILDNYARGRTRHIWFSISSDLVMDARRDLSDIGCHIKVIDGCQQLDHETRAFGLATEFKEGIVFSTYATLVSSVHAGGALSTSRKSRLQQLIDWCGGANFEGCLVFDECHKAKNFVPGNDTASTKVAVAVSTIQKMLPRARVLYCSATGVSDVANMAYMERLGLWGPGCAFKSFEHFHDTVRHKGLGIAEMLAMEMKSSGLYVSRGLSYRQTQFQTVEVALSEDQVKMYNMAAHVWNELRTSLEVALVRTGAAATRTWTNFWASHQRFFRQLCLGLKVGAIVEETTRCLTDNYCVVIGLQTTGEASLDSEVKRGTINGFVSICREILLRFIEQNFPTTISVETQGLGQDAQGGPAVVQVQEAWCQQAKEMLINFVKKMKLPDSPLDELIDKLGGPERVAEMTGRRSRIVRRSGEVTVESRAPDANCLDSLNVRERNLFMEGKKLIAIISDAASTGISLHADARCQNQRQRIHLTVELPWSAEKAVQQMGRTHRSNQTSGPVYKLLTTSVGGERRFAAAVARRLQSLGALTKGDRRAASGADMSEFNFDTPYGRSALKAMYNAICQKQLPATIALTEVCTGGPDELDTFNSDMLECLNEMGVLEGNLRSLAQPPKVQDKSQMDVSRFLNRILGLKISRQNTIFNYFSKCLDAHVAAAQREGRYNEGLVDIVASSVNMIGQPRVIHKISSTNNPARHVVLNVDRGMSWESALARLHSHPHADNGFYRSRHEIRGQRLWLLATLKSNTLHTFVLARPNTGVSNFEEDRSDLMKKYEKVTPESTEEGWNKLYETYYKNCIHGNACKARPHCTVGSRTYRLHLLCGGVITLMSLLEQIIAFYGGRLQLSKAETSLRVIRVQLDNGQRVVGVRFPEQLIGILDNVLQQQQQQQQLSRLPTTLTLQQILLQQQMQHRQQIRMTQLQNQLLSVGAGGGRSAQALQAALAGMASAGGTSTMQASAITSVSSIPLTAVTAAVLPPTAAALASQLLGASSAAQMVDLPATSLPADGNAQQSAGGGGGDGEKEAVEEPVTPVNAKLLAKALTAPVTIRNFFKSSQPSSSSSSPMKQSGSQSTLVSDSSGIAECSTKASFRQTHDALGPNAAMTTTKTELNIDCAVAGRGKERCVDSDEDTTDNSDGTEAALHNGSVDANVSLISDTIKESIEETVSDSRDCIVISDSDDSHCATVKAFSSNNVPTNNNKVSPLRPSKSFSGMTLLSPPLKTSPSKGVSKSSTAAASKAKSATGRGQTSIQAMFQRQSTMLSSSDSKSEVRPTKASSAGDAGKRKSSTVDSMFKTESQPSKRVKAACPICCHEFDAKTSSIEINRHIDACIAE